MRSLIFFAVRIMSVRLAVILLSLAQTTLWAAVLGLEAFGIASVYIGAQAIASLLGRFGSDNLIVRNYKRDPSFRARFPGFLIAVFGMSLVAGLIVLVVVMLVVFRAWQGLESGVFVLFVIGFNLSLVLSRILVVHKLPTLASILGNALPMAISTGLFALAGPALDRLPVSGPILAIGLLAFGHYLAALASTIWLRGFLMDCLREWRANPQRIRILFGPEQWYFLGYQSMGMARSQGVTLAIAALFGSTTTGVFALANRFGNLLTYLNEPARLFAMPRVADKSTEQIGRLYFRMLWLNAGLGLAGIAFLIGLYVFVTPPFPTDPPFPLYTLIIMTGAAFNLFVGPVGIILAMSGNERNNFFANVVGLVIVIACISLAAITGTVLLAVISVAVSSVAINLVNTLKLVKIMRSS